MDNKEIRRLSEEMGEYMTTVRRDLHMIPELGNELPQTAAYVEKELKDMGIPYRLLMDGNAIVATINGKGPGRTIALRADMDALPVKEETGLPFASTNGRMHACGHDGHTAMALGTARLLNSIKDTFNGNVKFLFQPGEEYPGGALPMIEEGALLDPAVDAVIGCHEGHINPEVHKGNLGFCVGETMASMDRVLLRVRGKGVHGAYPEQGIDAVVIAAEIITSLQKIISREKKTTDYGLISICRINGGFNQNILPDVVEMEGTVRATNEDVRQMMARRIREISQGIASVYGAECEVEYEFKYPPLVNDPDFTAFARGCAADLLGEESITDLKKPIMGGEDMAYFLREVPGTFFFLQNPSEIDGRCHPHHNPKFDVDESYFPSGCAVFTKIILEYLGRNS